jgi:diaminobutyrate-2-oxoglutarate transaminase
VKYDSELFPDKLNVMLPLRRTNPMDIFEEVESEVRLYCRIFPTVFDKACGSFLYDIDGKRYLDFFSGAGALNYGHNNPFLMKAIVNYISNNGITHALDMSTMAKKEFLTTFKQEILNPRGLDYKVMFCGSTGTNAVEASLKLARKVKDRNTIFAFSGSFHGMSLGSLSVTSNKLSRTDLMGSLHSVVFMPFPYDFNMCFDTIEYIRNTLEDDHSGVNIPAAIILETVQAEGGVIIAPSEWLYKLRKLCDEYDILLICDDIQVGCYRTGNFFRLSASILCQIWLSFQSPSAGLVCQCHCC